MSFQPKETPENKGDTQLGFPGWLKIFQDEIRMMRSKNGSWNNPEALAGQVFHPQYYTLIWDVGW